MLPSPSSTICQKCCERYLSSPRHGSHICSPVASFRCPPSFISGARPPRYTPVGSTEKHRWAPGEKLGTGEHMWDPCRGELKHLSQHFWQMVLEGDGSTLGSERVSAVQARTACSQSRTAETLSRPAVESCRFHVCWARCSPFSPSRSREKQVLSWFESKKAIKDPLKSFGGARPLIKHLRFQ